MKGSSAMMRPSRVRRLKKIGWVCLAVFVVGLVLVDISDGAIHSYEMSGKRDVDIVLAVILLAVSTWAAKRG